MKDDRKSWMEEGEEPDIQVTEYDITSTPNDFNVLTISSFLDAGSIILPPYQRNYIWDKARASKLIELLIWGCLCRNCFFMKRQKTALLS